MIKKQPHTTHSAIDPSLPETYSSKTFSSLLPEWSLPFGYRTFCLLFRSPFGYKTKSPVIEWSNGPWMSNYHSATDYFWPFGYRTYPITQCLLYIKG